MTSRSDIQEAFGQCKLSKTQCLPCTVWFRKYKERPSQPLIGLTCERCNLKGDSSYYANPYFTPHCPWMNLIITYHLRLIFLQQSSSNIGAKLHCALKALQHNPSCTYINTCDLHGSRFNTAVALSVTQVHFWNILICSTAQRRKSLTILKKHSNRERHPCLREQWTAFSSGCCSKSLYISLAIERWRNH